MAIKSSEFYKKLETLETARQTGISNLREKGLDVSDIASIPSIVNKIKDISPVNYTNTILETNGNRIIYAADLPDTYIYLIKDGVILEKKKTPDVTGGVVYFVVDEDGDFTVVRSQNDFSEFTNYNEHMFENLSTTYTFELTEDGYYESKVYNTRGSAYALCKITFNVEEDNSVVVLDIAEKGYNRSHLRYGLISKLDCVLQSSTSESDTSDVYCSRDNIPDKVYYTNVSKGEHFITVKWRTGNANYTEKDSLKFKLESISNGVGTIVKSEGVGQYVVKSPLPLFVYSWEQINLIAKNHYGQYIFNLGSTKVIPFMDAEYPVTLIDFENVKDIYGNNLNMTFSLLYTRAYVWDSKSANVSWVGCSLRANCLEKADVRYIYDSNVSSSTSGIYYIWDNENKVFVQKKLPEEYEAKTKYYKTSAVLEDGVFITSLKSALGDVSPALVNNDTWSGWGGNVTNESTALADTTIIRTQDKLWLMSDSNVFGDTNRVSLGGVISKFSYEGKHFEYYKTYSQSKFANNLSYASWFRSPLTRSSNYIAVFYGDGRVSYMLCTDNAYPLLCFSL